MCCRPLGVRFSISQHMMTTRTPEQAAAAAPGTHAVEGYGLAPPGAVLAGIYR